MWSKFSLGFKITVTLVVALGVAIISGCGKLAPLSPDTQQEYEQLTTTQSVESKWGVNSDFSSSPGMIGNGADTIFFNLFGFSSRFIVKEDSKSLPVKVACKQSAQRTNQGMRYVYDFGPDGLRFNPAAILDLEMRALDYDNPDPSRPFAKGALYWWDQRRSEWVFLREIQPNGEGRVAFNIDHFSKYSICGKR